MAELIQLASPKKNPSIGECFERLIPFCKNWVDYHFSSIEVGISMRYNGTQERKQTSDRQSSDTTYQLL